MKWFLVSPFSINVLNVSILLAFMIYFLIRLERKSRATIFLITFFIGVELVFVSFILIFSTLNLFHATIAWWVLHLVIFTCIAMVQFAYNFPENFYPKESKIVLIICTVASCIAYPHYIYRTFSMEPIYSFEGYSYVFLDVPEIGIVIGAEIVWILTVFFRNAFRLSGYAYTGIFSKWLVMPKQSFSLKRAIARFSIACIKVLRARERQGRAVRNMLLLFISPIILIFSIILAYQGLLSWVISAHILGTGCVIIAFIFIILYINNSSEPSTFMIKLIGISLGTILIAFGLAANIAILIQDDAYDKRRMLEVEQCKDAIFENNMSKIPNDVLYIVAHPIQAEPSSQMFRVIFERNGGSEIRDVLQDENRGIQRSKGVVGAPVKREPIRGYRQMAAPDARHNTIYYEFVSGDEIFEVGYSYVEYRKGIHGTGLKLIYIILGFVLFIIAVFPYFFKESLVKPLNHLLDGVKKVNRGNLEVVVPVQVDDEIGFLSGSFNNMVRSIREARQDLKGALDYQVRLTESYSYFVPKELLKFLKKRSIVDIRLGDNVQKEMTILFSDIRSFTMLSERMTPQENFNFINSCLKRIGPVVRRNKGFIDKYIGDAVMALFPRSAGDAVKAGIAMQEVIKKYNADRLKTGYEPIRIGVGMHTGTMMLGTIGEEKRMEGTVISDAVNLAARVESLTKLYGTSIIMSANTLKSLGRGVNFHYRFLDRVQVKGKKKWVEIYEVFDGDASEIIAKKQKTKKDFENGIARYQERKFSDAIRHFEKALEIFPQDQAAHIYVNRCRKFQKYGVPEDWEGVTAMEEK